MMHASTPSALNFKEIIFIDQGINNYHSLINGAKLGTEIHILESAQDGVLQIKNF